MADELKIEILTEGTGPQPQPGQTIQPTLLTWPIWKLNGPNCTADNIPPQIPQLPPLSNGSQPITLLASPSVSTLS